MELLKEIVIDVLVLLAGLVIVTAEGVYDKGLSCDGNRAEVAAAQSP